MTVDAGAITRIAGEAEAAHPAPALVVDLDAQTRRAVARAAAAVGLSEQELWSKTLAASSGTRETDAEAQRIAAAVRRR